MLEGSLIIFGNKHLSFQKVALSSKKLKMMRRCEKKTNWGKRNRSCEE
jgi:hypothetical protein